MPSEQSLSFLRMVKQESKSIRQYTLCVVMELTMLSNWFMHSLHSLHRFFYEKRKYISLLVRSERLIRLKSSPQQSISWRCRPMKP